MKNSIFILTAIFILSLTLNFSCKKDDNLGPEPPVSAIDSNLRDSLFNGTLDSFNSEFSSLAEPIQPEIIYPPELISEETNTERGWTCVRKRYTAAPGNSDVFLYSPSEVFYLSSLVDLGSITSGGYRPVIAPLSPKTISISLENIAGTPSITVENPSLSTIRTGVVEMLQQLGSESTPARMSFNKDKVYSYEQLGVALKGKYSGYGANINASFNWNSTNINSRMLYEFTQLYYTMDMDLTHQTPAEYFQDLPDIGIFEDNIPVYLSSVKYGRNVLIAVESSSSYEDLEAAFNASFSGFIGSGGISISAEHKQILESSSISAYIVGGNGLDGAGVINSIDNLEDLLINGANYSPQSPGVPLSYNLRFLHNNELAKMVNAADYVIQDCVEVGEKYSFKPFRGARQDFCPVETGNGNQFGNHVNVSGSIKLNDPNTSNEIWATIEITMEEVGGNGTRADIHSQNIYLGTLPNGTHFESWISPTALYISYFDNDREPEFPLMNEGFIKKVEIVAEAGSRALPCVGYRGHDPDDRAYVAVWFDEVEMTIGYNE